MTIDSSIYRSRAHTVDNSIRTGVVREAVYNKTHDSILYIVDVYFGLSHYQVVCHNLVKFGGPFNYEEYTRHTWPLGSNIIQSGEAKYRPGDLVVIGLINGQSATSEPTGVIIGSLKHTARKRSLELNEVAYQSEFNGIETSINNDGEFTQTFRGVPTNSSVLSESPNGQVIPAPQYDTDIGTSFYKWYKDGSWRVSDNAKQDPQHILINKPSGQIVVTSGKTTLIIDKAKQSYTINNKSTTINSSSDVNVNTITTTIRSSKLFDLESELIKTKGSWEQQGPMDIKGNITHTGMYKQQGHHIVEGSATITAGLIAQGQCSLGGGSQTLVYDIPLIIGTGNLGFPVISYPVLLKTVRVTAD